MKPIEAREGNNGGRGPQGKVHAGPDWTAEHDAGKFAAFTGGERRAPRPVRRARYSEPPFTCARSYVAHEDPEMWTPVGTQTIVKWPR